MAKTTAKTTTKAAKATKTTKAAPKKAATKARKQPVRTKSVALDKNPSDFMKPRFTIQTIYWLIICALFLAFGLWILSLQMKVHRIYDQIEANQTLDIIEAPKTQQTE